MSATGIVQAAAPLPSLLIQRSDLTTGYSQPLAAGYLSSPQIPDGAPVSARTLRAYGYVRTYAVQFELQNARTHTISRIIEESIDQYRTVSGAHRGLMRMIAGRYPQAMAVNLPRAGNEWRAYSLMLPQPPGRARQLLFRRGRYVVDLLFGAEQGQLQGPLQAMVNLIDGRIRARG